VDQQRSTRPLNLLAASECNEGQDVIGKRLEAGPYVAASKEGIKGGIFGDTLPELLDGGNAAGDKGEVERAERDVNHRDSRRLFVLLDSGSGCFGSGLFLGSSVVLRKDAAIEGAEVENTGQQDEERDNNVRFHWPAPFSMGTSCSFTRDLALAQPAAASKRLRPTLGAHYTPAAVTSRGIGW